MTDIATGNTRLLMVAKALRESPNPNEFTMETFAPACNTPACALGHYAFRRDLQDAFRLVEHKIYGTAFVKADDPLNMHCFPDGYAVTEHFAIDMSEAYSLFGAEGCDDVGSAIEAAEYIEQFVAERGECREGQ